MRNPLRIALCFALLASIVPAWAQSPATPTAPAPVPRPAVVRPARPIPPDAPALTPGAVTRLIPVRHVDASGLMDLLVPTFGGLVEASWGEDFKVLAVSGAPEDVQRFEEEVRKLDVPPKNIELTVYVLRGTLDPQAASPPPDPVKPVVERLRESFPFTAYTAIDTLVLRTRSGREVHVVDSVGLGEGVQLKQQVRALVRLADESSGPLVRVEEFEYESELQQPPKPLQQGGAMVVPSGANSQPARFTASLDVPPGQGALAGKVSFADADGAMFVVVLLRVVE